MSFLLNESQQLSLFDALGFLSERKLHILEKSWAKAFSDNIFVNIDEMIFAPLYSEKTNSRPNAPVNVIVGALILKELSHLTDDEIREECEFDLRFQYALHTTSFEEQPISDRTFSRFRERNAAYELATGRDLIHECISGLSEHIRRFMEIDQSIQRMDSMMIESNIRKMGRLELLYTCLSNLVKEVHRDGHTEFLEGLEHYADPNDRNRVVYYDKETPQGERLQKIIDDAASLLPRCEKDYHGTEDYQLLERAVSEQTKDGDNGHLIPKDKADGMDSSVLQNPSDPDATYRIKAGKQHRGYVANITEAVDGNGSVITNYQYDVNTRSDSSFIKEAIENATVSEETVAVIADGAYSGEDIQEQASLKNIGVLTTGLTGRKPKGILSEFTLSGDGKSVISCPAGHKPKSSSYISQTGLIRVSFLREKCAQCPQREECNPVLKKRTALMYISVASRVKVLAQKNMQDDEVRQLIGRIRNGVETVPSIIRNKYGVDHMPVRGKLKTKQFFGFKVAAFNFIKMFRFIQGKTRCMALQPK